MRSAAILHRRIFCFGRLLENNGCLFLARLVLCRLYVRLYAMSRSLFLVVLSLVSGKISRQVGVLN